MAFMKFFMIKGILSFGMESKSRASSTAVQTH